MLNCTASLTETWDIPISCMVTRFHSEGLSVVTLHCFLLCLTQHHQQNLEASKYKKGLLLGYYVAKGKPLLILLALLNKMSLDVQINSS